MASFVQSILGRERLPSWEEMWAALQQEELRRDLVKVNLNGSSGSGMKTKKEENTALASKGQCNSSIEGTEANKMKEGHFKGEMF